MKQSVTKQTTKKEYIYTCDVCQRSGKYIRLQICDGCDKEICCKCIKFVDTDPWEGGCGDDCCTKCYEYMKPLSKKAQQVRENAEFEIGQLRERWEKLCRKLT